MSFIPPIYLDFNQSREKDETQYLYRVCINRVFELYSLLEDKKLPRITKALNTIDLKAEQQKARYLSGQIETLFKN